MRGSAFWGLFAVFFFTAIAMYTIGVQAVAYLVETGFEPIEAATAFGSLGVLSVAGMICTGWFSDRAGRRTAVTMSFGLTFLGIALLMTLAVAPHHALLVAFVVAFGLSQGSRGPVVSTLCAELFAGGGLGAIYGAITLGMGLGAALGAWVSGVMFDLAGGYHAGFLFAMAAAALGLARFWLVPALAGRR